MARCRPFAPRLPIAVVAVVVILVMTWAHAHAAETWKVTGGRTTFNFYTTMLADLGITLEVVEVTSSTPDPIVMDLEPPYWSWAITPESDLRFPVENEHFASGGMTGTIRHRGGVTLRDARSGTSRELRDWILERIPQPNDGPGGRKDPATLFARQPDAGSTHTLAFEDEMPIFRRDTRKLIMYATAVITPEWARELGRPWLAGQPVARIEVAADAEYVTGASTEPPFVPITGGYLDVKLGYLDNLNQVGHLGTHPFGTSALSMATTSCNVGDVDVPWLGPMNRNHPGIVMAIYRLLDGRFEQVGISYVKHGFFALSGSDCSECQHPSPGTFLGVGCSDTYGSGNNADRTYLGPRREWNPFAGTWECIGSHFSGGVPDCTRRHTGSGHDPVQHRLAVKDWDLDNADATYFFEGYYVVAGDQDKHNNIGSHECTVDWADTIWMFATSDSLDAPVEGPAIERWGDVRNETAMAADDGKVILASQVTDLGGGTWHYEYALFNFDSWREVQKVAIPVGEAAVNLHNIGFHDWDSNPANDWSMTLDDGVISWETTPFASDSTANALTFGMLMNFRFDADVAPAAEDQLASLTSWRPGAPSPAGVTTQVPLSATSVPAHAAGGAIQLGPARPNPLDPGTTIHFELGLAANAVLDIFGAEGRLIRQLHAGPLAAGAHSVVWDGTDRDGSRVAPGVYYYRLTAGAETAARSLVVIR